MRRALFLVLVVALLASPGAAAAHPVVSTQTIVSTPTVEVAPPDLREVIAAAPMPDAPPWAALLLSVGVALVVARRPRRTIPVLLVLVAAVLAFETGVHSTHHLGEDLSSCSVASAASQIIATIDDAAIAGMPCGIAEVTVSVPLVPLVVSGVLAPDAGRAPPLPSA